MVVFMRRRQLAMAAAGVLAALALLLIVPGCQRSGGKTEPVKAADNAARVAYLEGLGWQVTPEPLETLSLLLPEDLSGHTEYTALQFRSCQFRLIPQGVQANLFVCGDQVIAGDITSLGQDGFRRSLQFPEQ